MKQCKDCKIEKTYMDFYKDKKNKDGFGSYCKDCSNIRISIYKENNRERLKKLRNKYYLENKETILNKSKIYRIKNKETIKTKKSIYGKIHKKARYEKNLNPESRFNRALVNSKSRGIVWGLKKEEYLNLIKNNCSYCDNNLGSVQSSTGIGLDRINNDKNIGYVVSNVVPCCSICNKIKNNFLTQQECKAAIIAVLNIRLKNSQAAMGNVRNR